MNRNMFHQLCFGALIFIGTLAYWFWPTTKSGTKASKGKNDAAGGDKSKKKKKKGKKDADIVEPAKEEGGKPDGEKKKKRSKKKKKGGSAKIKELEEKLAELGGAVDEEEAQQATEDVVEDTPKDTPVDEPTAEKEEDPVAPVEEEDVPVVQPEEPAEEQQEETTAEETEAAWEPVPEPGLSSEEEAVVVPKPKEEDVPGIPVVARSYNELVAKPKTHLHCSVTGVTFKMEYKETHLRGKKHKKALKAAGMDPSDYNESYLTPVPDPDAPPTPEIMPMQASPSVAAMLENRPLAAPPARAPAAAPVEEEYEEEWDEEEYDEEEYDEEDEEVDEMTQAEEDHAAYLEKMIAMRESIGGVPEVQYAPPAPAAVPASEDDDSEEEIEGWTHISSDAVESTPGWM